MEVKNVFTKFHGRTRAAENAEDKDRAAPPSPGSILQFAYGAVAIVLGTWMLEHGAPPKGLGTLLAVPGLLGLGLAALLNIQDHRNKQHLILLAVALFWALAAYLLRQDGAVLWLQLKQWVLQ